MSPKPTSHTPCSAMTMGCGFELDAACAAPLGGPGASPTPHAAQVRCEARLCTVQTWQGQPSFLILALASCCIPCGSSEHASHDKQNISPPLACAPQTGHIKSAAMQKEVYPGVSGETLLPRVAAEPKKGWSRLRGDRNWRNPSHMEQCAWFRRAATQSSPVRV